MALSTLKIRNQKAARTRREYRDVRAFVDELLIDARAERALARRARVIRLAALVVLGVLAFGAAFLGVSVLL